MVDGRAGLMEMIKAVLMVDEKVEKRVVMMAIM